MHMIQKQRGVKLACLLVALAWSGAVHAQTMFGLTPGASHGRSAPDRNGAAASVGHRRHLHGRHDDRHRGDLPAALRSDRRRGHVDHAESDLDRVAALIAIPAGVLSRMADGVAFLGVFNTNPLVYQVATTIDYSWPNIAAVLAPGGAPWARFPVRRAASSPTAPGPINSEARPSSRSRRVLRRAPGGYRSSRG